jgi:hypothetical protein
VTLSLFVHALEIRVPEQTCTAWELTPPAGIGHLGAAVWSESAHQSRLQLWLRNFRQNPKRKTLLTEAGRYRHPLAALGAPTRNYRAAGLGLHPRTKSVRLRAVTTVGLECALGHEKSLLLMMEVSFKANEKYK